MTAVQFDSEFLDRMREAFASQLPAFLPRQRWFGSKARSIHSVSLADCVVLRLPHGTALLTFARVEYTQGAGETYVLPLLLKEEQKQVTDSEEAILHIPNPHSGSDTVLVSALNNQEFLNLILTAIQGAVSYPGTQGEFRAISAPALRRAAADPSATLAARLLKAEQSNTSVVYGSSLILKFFRRIEEGINPDLEISRFLSDVAHFENTPAYCGSLEYRTREGKSMTLGILQGFVPNRGDAWRFTTESLTQFLVEAAPVFSTGTGKKTMSVSSFLDASSAKNLSKSLNALIESLGLLGRRTAELHLALASSNSDPAFSPQGFDAETREALETSLHDLAVRNFDLLRRKAGELPESLRDSVAKALKIEDDALLAFHSTLEKDIRAVRTRIHGDYHLGQVLFTGSDFFIIDFEGEPAKPVSERRNKRSPLQDVAGMLRSIHYAARSSLLGAREKLPSSPNMQTSLAVLAKYWQARTTENFLEQYRKTAKGAPFLPPASEDFDRLLRLHLLEKAIYELGYELNNRPDWLAIPLEGIGELLGNGPLA